MLLPNLPSLLMELFPATEFQLFNNLCVSAAVNPLPSSQNPAKNEPERTSYFEGAVQIVEYLTFCPSVATSQLRRGCVRGSIRSERRSLRWQTWFCREAILPKPCLPAAHSPGELVNTVLMFRADSAGAPGGKCCAALPQHAPERLDEGVHVLLLTNERRQEP